MIHRVVSQTQSFAKDLKSLFGFLRSFSSEKDLKPRGSDWSEASPRGSDWSAERDDWSEASIESEATIESETARKDVPFLLN